MRRGSEAPDSLPLVTARRRLPGSGARCGLVAASLVSSFASLLPTATFLYLLIDHDCWAVIMARCHRWLERNHWDVKVRGRAGISLIRTIVSLIQFFLVTVPATGGQTSHSKIR